MRTIRFGLDYAGRILAQSHKAVGSSFACRYLSTPGNPKNATGPEVWQLRENGVDVVLVFETTGRSCLGGRNAGMGDARSARAQANALKFPATRPIYFAVDFDATPGQQAAINDYFRGVASIIGLDRTGMYAGYYPLKRAFDAKVVTYGWQTYAWSGGLVDHRAHLYQYSNAHVVAGTGVDYNHALKEDFAQWGFVAPKPKPQPKPKPEHQRGKGVAVMRMEVDLATLEAKITPEPAAEPIIWERGPVRSVRKSVELKLGGKNAGHWSHGSLPFGK